MTITAERALADAARLERRARRRAAMPFFGVAYSLKDLTWTREFGPRWAQRISKITCRAPIRNTRLDRGKAGGILFGKTTTPEFGGRPTTEGGLCPAAHNPWKLEFTAGGSSGGAAAQLPRAWVQSRRAATAAARFASRRRVADWSESSLRAAASPTLP